VLIGFFSYISRHAEAYNNRNLTTWDLVSSVSPLRTSPSVRGIDFRLLTLQYLETDEGKGFRWPKNSLQGC
jgi:hypothetical protein